jgi:hypothetical protein
MTLNFFGFIRDDPLYQRHPRSIDPLFSCKRHTMARIGSGDDWQSNRERDAV